MSTIYLIKYQKYILKKKLSGKKLLMNFPGTILY